MAVKIARETDGRVTVTVTLVDQSSAAVITPIEARLLAIKLLLAAENVEQAN